MNAFQSKNLAIVKIFHYGKDRPGNWTNCSVGKIKESSKPLNYLEGVRGQHCNNPPSGTDVEAPPVVLGNTLYLKWSPAREKIQSDPVVGRV